MPTGHTARVGTVSKRKDGNYIKVTDDGPRRKRWVRYGRWLWETHNGPVPAGKRVAHADGDVFNDDFRNLVLVEAADILFIHCHSDEQKSQANRRKRTEATAKSNRLRAMVRRQREYLPSRWYIINEANGLILNEPQRKAVHLLRLLEIDHEPRRLHQTAMGFPDMTRGEALLLRCLEEPAWSSLQLFERVKALTRQLGQRPLTTDGITQYLSTLRARDAITGKRQDYTRCIEPLRRLLILRGEFLKHFAGYEQTSDVSTFLMPPSEQQEGIAA